MKKAVITLFFVVIVCCFSGCTIAEDEILGTWKYEKEYKVSGVGDLYNKSVYVFKKENGNYLGTFTIDSSISSSPASYDFTYKVEDSKLEITSLETGKIQTIDYAIENDVLKLGKVEYNKVKK